MPTSEPQRTGSASSGRRRQSSERSENSPRNARRRTQHERPSVTEWIAAHSLLLCLAAILVIAFLAEMPWLTRPTRTLALQVDVVLTFTLAAAAAPAERWLSVVRRGINPWILALLAWCCLCAFRAPYHAFAMAELLRLVLGAGVYFLAAYVLRPQETRLLPYVLIGLGAAVGLYGIIEFGSGVRLSDGEVHSIFGNHEQFGSLLALLFPPALALALDRERPPKELLFAQGAALILGAALLLTRTRSAWAGAAVSCLLLSLLALRYSPIRLNRSNKALIVGPTLLVILAFAGLMTFSALAPLVSRRAATLSHALDDTSFADRLHRWRSACRMASEHPIAGWGLGSWPVMEGRWTHQGDDAPLVLANGTGHSNLAHNYWVQWAAETGGIGLALHVGLIAAFFLLSLRALPHLNRDRRTLLLACIVAIASGVVDMIGAPSYTFPGVSSLFWIWLGLGMAILREADLRRDDAPIVWAAPVAIGLSASLLVLGIGWDLRAGGRSAPLGTLTVTADPSGPVAPGRRVLWSATYRAPDGSLRPTTPGMVWHITEGHLEKPSPTYISANNDPQRSGLQGNIFSPTGLVTVQGAYEDNFGRLLTATRTVAIAPAK